MGRPARTAAALAAALLLATGIRAAEPNVPEPPRASVDIPALKTTGRTIQVPAGGDLQKALDEAKGGDRIELEPRATYEGPFRLKAKDGDGWIVIASAGALPKPGRHVQPSSSSRPSPARTTIASSPSSSRRRPARSSARCCSSATGKRQPTRFRIT
jgi:hypothetical protein